MTQAAEEALEQGVWADAASGQLWAAQRLGPAGTSPAEVWTALAALGARPRRLAWLSDMLLVCSASISCRSRSLLHVCFQSRVKHRVCHMAGRAADLCATVYSISGMSMAYKQQQGCKPAAVAAISQGQTLLPMLGEPPGAPPAVQYGDGDATLTWRGAPDAEATSLEASLLAVLQFVAGAGTHQSSHLQQPLRYAGAVRVSSVDSRCKDR